MFLQNAAAGASWGAMARLRARLPSFLADISARPRWLLLFLLGRFLRVRRLVAAFANRAEGTAVPPACTGDGIRTELDISAIVATLRRDGICASLQLPPRTVAEIRAYAEAQPCYGGLGWNTPVLPGGHAEAERRSGSRILAAAFPEVDRECPAVAHLLRDGWLHAVAAGYLGASAQVIDVRLWWSFPARGASRTELSRVAQDTFHFDLADWGQLKFFFYLTDVDAETGAHVYVRGSHAQRPLSHQFTPFVAKTNAQIAAAYGPRAILVMDGPAGTGFVEDPFGFHTGTAVRRDRRLILELSFGITGLLRRRPYGKAEG